MAEKIDKFKIWENRINLAKKNQEGEEKNIHKWRKYYRGIQWPETADSDEQGADKFRHKAIDNIIFSNIRTILPSINFRNPRLFVSPKKKPFNTKDGLFDTIASSAILEAILNYYYKELEVKRQIDKCLLDALLGPWGVMQVGFTTRTEKIRKKPDKEGGKISEIGELKKESSPFISRISPLDFLVDPEAKDHFLSDAAWIAFKWVKRLEDVKDNPDFKDTENLQSNYRVKDPKTNSGVQIAGDSDKSELSADWDRVEGWDIWDKRTKKIYVYVPGHIKLLQERDWPLETDGFPVEILFFNENPDSLFPISDVDIIRRGQDELNWIRSYQLEHIKNISQRKWAVKAGTIEQEEIEKLIYGPDGTIIETNGNPNDTIIPLRDSNISQDIYLVANDTKRAALETSGVSEFERGGARKFETAAEPVLIAQSTGIRRDERTGILESFIIHIMRKFSQILQQTMEPMSIPLAQETGEEIARFASSKLEKIAGTEDAALMIPWLNASKNDIKGEYEFSIEVGSTRPINQEIRKQDILTLTQVLMDSPYVNNLEGTRRILEAFEIRDIDKLLKTDEQVQAEQQAAMEAQTQSQIAIDQPKRDTDLQKTMIKSDTTLKTTAMKSAGDIRTTLLKGLTGGKKE